MSRNASTRGTQLGNSLVTRVDHHGGRDFPVHGWTTLTAAVGPGCECHTDTLRLFLIF